MPTLMVRPDDVALDAIIARIRLTIPAPRPISVKYGRGVLYSVELPDATAGEATAVENDLRANFPRETSVDWIPAVVPLVMPTAALAWTNMPAAVTEFRALTLHRSQFSLAPFKEARLVANVQAAGFAGPPAAALGIQASTDGGTTWQSLTGVLNSAAPSLTIETTGTLASAIVTIAGALRIDVLLRLVGRDGNGVVDPSFGNICLQVR